MSFISEIDGIFNPGGDPAAIRQAAGSAQELASSLRNVSSTLDHVATVLGKTWKGSESPQDESAAQAFQKAWANLSREIGNYADSHASVAKALEKIANEIETAQQQAARLKEMALIAVAVAAATALFSFGASEIAAAAAVAEASEEGISLAAALAEVLSDGTAVINDLLDAISSVTARFLMGAAFSWASEAATKKKEGIDPFNLANYSAEDIGNILLGGALTASLQGIPAKIPVLADFLDDNPVAGAGLYGMLGGALGSALSQKIIEGQSIDWGKVEESALVSGGTGALMGGGQALLRVFTGANNNLPDLLPKAPSTTGITGGDVLRGSIGIPSGAIFYLINFPKKAAAPGLPSASGEPATDPAAATTPSVTVIQSGQTLWEKTGGNWHEINAITKLNGIPDNRLVYPDEVVIEPPASS
jgi:uncharacterized protein YukE